MGCNIGGPGLLTQCFVFNYNFKSLLFMVLVLLRLYFVVLVSIFSFFTFSVSHVWLLVASVLHVTSVSRSVMFPRLSVYSASL